MKLSALVCLALFCQLSYGGFVLKDTFVKNPKSTDRFGQCDAGGYVLIKPTGSISQATGAAINLLQAYSTINNEGVLSMGPSSAISMAQFTNIVLTPDATAYLTLADNGKLHQESFSQLYISSKGACHIGKGSVVSLDTYSLFTLKATVQVGGTIELGPSSQLRIDGCGGAGKASCALDAGAQLQLNSQSVLGVNGVFTMQPSSKMQLQPNAVVTSLPGSSIMINQGSKVSVGTTAMIKATGNLHMAPSSNLVIDTFGFLNLDGAFTLATSAIVAVGYQSQLEARGAVVVQDSASLSIGRNVQFIIYKDAQLYVNVGSAVQVGTLCWVNVESQGKLFTSSKAKLSLEFMSTVKVNEGGKLSILGSVTVVVANGASLVITEGMSCYVQADLEIPRDTTVVISANSDRPKEMFCVHN